MTPFARVFCSFLTVVFFIGLFAVKTDAVITRLTPLKNIVDDSDQVALAKVESMDPARPSLVLEVTADIKGTTDPKRIPILLKGGAQGNARQILDRIKPGSQMIFFITQGTNQHIGLLFCEGAWYQLIGHPNEGGARWGYTHGEPYLRRTFKDSTQQMHEAIAAYLKDETELPAVNPQEKPGLGPTLDGQPDEPIESTNEKSPESTNISVIPTEPVDAVATSDKTGQSIGNTQLWLVVLVLAVIAVVIVKVVLTRRTHRVDDESDEVERITRDEALEAARAEASRDLVITDTSIRYVAYVADFDDHCLCEFVQEDAGWVKLIRVLTPSERLPVEEIPDKRIIQLARSGNKLSAIRLFRAKHEVGLQEGMRGVESLLQQAEPDAAADRGGM